MSTSITGPPPKQKKQEYVHSIRTLCSRPTPNSEPSLGWVQLRSDLQKPSNAMSEALVLGALRCAAGADLREVAAAAGGAADLRPQGRNGMPAESRPPRFVGPIWLWVKTQIVPQIPIPTKIGSKMGEFT